MKDNKTLKRIFLIAVSIQTILMGIFFIVQILRIYYGNQAQFTSEICKQYLLQILPIVIIWLILIIFSSIKFNDKDKYIAKISNITKLNNLENICPNLNDMDSEYILLKKEKQKCKIGLLICIIITIICSMMGLLYLLNVKHFSSNNNLSQQAIQMSIHLLPWCIISFGGFIAYSYYEEKSAKKSIDIIKTIIKNNGKKENIKNRQNNKKINIARLAIIAIALILIIIGINNGDAQSVLQKAINICTECIGLG